MQPTVTTGLTRFKAVSQTQAALLAVAAISSAVIWWQFAPRYFYQSAILERHESHVPWLLLHLVTGTSALFTGPFLLWSGFRRVRPALHRKIGLVYLVGGGLGSAAGIGLSILAKHRARPFMWARFFSGLSG